MLRLSSATTFDGFFDFMVPPAVDRQVDPLRNAAFGRELAKRALFGTHDQRLFFYPDSFAIIENSGMYREITMPPMLTPSRPMMTGSSMASMSLVAASTSSS